MAIKTVTLEEVRKIPPMTSKEIKELENHVDTDFSDCPVLTKEQLKDATRGYEAHPEWYKPTKSKITIMIDNDVLAVLKSEGKGYQTRINAILRKEVIGSERTSRFSNL